MNKKAAFYVLGCKVNQYELEAMKSLFRQAGYRIVDFEQMADVYVIHTCTVTHQGDRKSRQMIRRAVRKNPQAIVAVSGCYAQVAPGEILEIPGVDLVVGMQNRHKIVELVEKVAEKREPLNATGNIIRYRHFDELPLDEVERVRAFLKIEEGCDQFCSYCIVPFARGPVRSLAPDRVIEKVKQLVEMGFREIVLTGVHTGAYGMDLGEGQNLAGLLKKLVKISGLKRLRISSIDANDFDQELIDTVTEYPVICPHYHIPLQSGDDWILEKMKRRYTTGDYAKIIDALRSRRPEVSITTDVMVGFPGENEEHFENTFRFIKAMEFSDLHVFKYSRRAGTKAAEMPLQVDASTKEERSCRLIELGQELSQKYGRKFLGRTMDVLVEKQGEQGLWEGHTDNYLKVKFCAEGQWRGELVPVRLTEMHHDHISGQVIAL